MADVSGEGTRIGAPAPGGEGIRVGGPQPPAQPDGPKPDDMDFTTIPQDRLQRAFQVATGQPPTATGGGDMAVDPQAVKDAMKHLSNAYDKLVGKARTEEKIDMSGTRLDSIQAPGEEDASRTFVGRANPLGAQAYQALRAMADHIQQTYLAMQQQLADTVHTDQANADALRRQSEG